MVKINEIVVHWHEGTSTVPNDTSYSSLTAANKFARSVSENMRKGDGYHKIKYTIKFDVNGDEDSYTGRLDVHPYGEMQEIGTRQVCFLESARSFIGWYLKREPESLDLKLWSKILEAVEV